MTTDVEICNLALSNLRARQIPNLTEQSIEATTCALKYPIVRDVVLTKGDWGFNNIIEDLVVLDDTYDVFNWIYSYTYPTDCLYINRIVPDVEFFDGTVPESYYQRHDIRAPKVKQMIPHRIVRANDTRVIVANLADLKIDYRKRITETDDYGDDFVMAVSHLLASELAVPIMGGEAGEKIRMSELELYRTYMSEAVADSMNQQHSEPEESDFITVRG